MELTNFDLLLVSCFGLGVLMLTALTYLLNVCKSFDECEKAEKERIYKEHIANESYQQIED